MSTSTPIKVKAIVSDKVSETKAAQIAPYVNEHDELVVFNTYGEEQFKGLPSIKSWITWLTDHILMVEVEGSNPKTRTRQSTTGGGFYFVRESGRWVRHNANYGPIKDVLAASEN